MEIREDSDYIHLQFKYNSVMIHELKRMCPKTYFDRTTQTWRVLKTRQKEFDIWLQRFQRSEVINIMDKAGRYTIPELPELMVPHNLKIEPYPYQLRGIAYILDRRRVLCGDQPGLGKTLQSIAAVTIANEFPCIVICPATLKENWRREWMKVTGRTAMILNDRVKNTWQSYYDAKMIDVFIVNYESLEKFFVLGYEKPAVPEDEGKLKTVIFRPSVKIFKSAIVDESHRCRNPKTRWAVLTAGILIGKSMRILLSGTPMVNTPMDLWAQLALMGMHKLFPDEKHFVNRYVKVGIRKKPANLEELNYHLSVNCFYRREKSEVASQLPPKNRSVLYCDITNRKEYDKAEYTFIRYLEEVLKCTPDEIATKLRGEFMVKLGILKQISARGKLDTVREWVDSLIESREKVILFCNLREIIHAVKKFYPKALSISGEDTLAIRQESIDLFQNDPDYPLIICNFKAGGVGVTLTAATHVGFIEQPWHFADLEQCEDRAHRIGQKSVDEVESIDCMNFLGNDTMDDFCYEKVMEKKSIHDAIMGTTDKGAVEIVNNLLDLFKNRQKSQAVTAAAF